MNYTRLITVTAMLRGHLILCIQSAYLFVCGQAVAGLQDPVRFSAAKERHGETAVPRARIPGEVVVTTET